MAGVLLLYSTIRPSILPTSRLRRTIRVVSTVEVVVADSVMPAVR
jgi:hypothetical protein